ncbi:hypothetical protein [Caenispirillum salinarum]|uniref:hypothetical protein n=1 Tax=Caenispirillum salinarum TaxID=859058 RepID=UPI0038504795
MPRRAATTLMLCLLALPLAACEPSKADLLDKAEGITTKQGLRDALGKPDDIAKLGPIETWTYHADNGAVTFLIAGDAVTLKTAGGAAN